MKKTIVASFLAFGAALSAQAGDIVDTAVAAGNFKTLATALGAADLVLVASGTATLEAALFKRPMVIAYKMPWLSWQITNRKRLQPWVGLPNILCQDFVVPELLQDAATPQAMANALQHWLDHPEQVTHLQQAFQDLHQSLKQDMSSLARHALQEIIAA